MNERHYLFLIRRKAEWPRAWDSLINRCHHDLEHDVDDDTWFEEEYEKDELINRLPSGREIYSVKTPEDFAAEVAAEKAERLPPRRRRSTPPQRKHPRRPRRPPKTQARIRVPQRPPHNVWREL
ncbi:hypothetical protein MHU86_21940 [Fragilaria crotonensis]|nr:hypothetical protein MHU86_21940 [Fragilaria crotonensis]